MLYIKMDNNYKDLKPKGPAAAGLHPIRHKEFNEFIKGKVLKEGIIINLKI